MTGARDTWLEGTAFAKIVFFVVLIGLQGALPVLLPNGFVPPDLFLLAALALTARLRAPFALLAAYGFGLAQDAFGAGLVGFHAAGIAAGVYAALGVRRILSAETGINHGIAVGIAELAKWAVFAALNYWTRQGLITAQTWPLVFVPELVATLVIGPFMYAFAAWAFGPVPDGDDRLL